MDIKYFEEQEIKRIEHNISYAENGVTFIDIKRTYIDEGVEIGRGTVIYPDVILEGNVTIGEDCIIGPSSRIRDSKVGNGTEIQNSIILESSVGDKTSVGPFAYLRPGSEVGSRCKVGDFVELKNSKMGDGSKSAHLTYIGDSDVGCDVNIGCGTVFVNYDGKNKFRSNVGDRAFIGCNTNLVSPVKVGDDAYIAAGSTITKDVKEGALVISRVKGETTIEGWVEKKGLKRESTKQK